MGLFTSGVLKFLFYIDATLSIIIRQGSRHVFVVLLIVHWQSYDPSTAHLRERGSLQGYILFCSRLRKKEAHNYFETKDYTSNTSFIILAKTNMKITTILTLLLASLRITAGVESAARKNQVIESAAEKDFLGTFSQLQFQVQHLLGGFAALQMKLDATNAEVAVLQMKLDTTNAEVAALRAIKANKTNVDALQAKTSCISASSSATNLIFRGCNVNVQNGKGSTPTTNTNGNLIIGYNELDGRVAADRVGSHNFVVGPYHAYTSHSGIVVGVYNKISGEYSSVSGGSHNVASGTYSSVSGGQQNNAGGQGSSVSGGALNTADGFGSSVSGGEANTAGGGGSSVSGGQLNTAGGASSSVSGGYDNTADGGGSSVSGGQSNIASGGASVVVGGGYNNASGIDSVAVGNKDGFPAGTTSCNNFHICPANI